jgi:hypothetical protein
VSDNACAGGCVSSLLQCPSSHKGSYLCIFSINQQNFAGVAGFVLSDYDRGHQSKLTYIQRNALTAYGHLKARTGSPKQKESHSSSLIGTLYDSLQLTHKVSDTSNQS